MFRTYVHNTILASIYMLAIIMVASCKHDEKEGHVRVKQRKTVVVYMASENSLSRFANADMNEMSEACKDIPLDCNFVIYNDNAFQPFIYTITAQKGLSIYKELPEQDSANPQVFYSTLKTIISSFPAEHYSLVLWSHGTGWITANSNTPYRNPRKTIFIDNNENNGSNNTGSELEIADLRKSLEKLNVHWDNILLDACFMQCVEVAYELRKVTDYIVASPAEIPDRGAPYDRLVKYLASTEENSSIEISKQYAEYYNNPGVDMYGETTAVVLSVVKTSELDNLLKLTSQFLPEYFARSYDLPTSNIQTYAPYNQQSLWSPEYYDIGSAMAKFLKVEDYNIWKKQLDKVVVSMQNNLDWRTSYDDYEAKIIDAEHIALMSIYIPNEKYDMNTTLNKDIKSTLWYQDFISQ